MRNFLPFIFFLALSCNNNNSNDFPNSKTDTLSKEINSDSSSYQLIPFGLLKNYPFIDTASFIKELKNNCHITGVYPKWKDTILHETINVFKKIKLNGNNKEYYLVEYDWHGNHPNVEFPWKKQFLFDSSGILIKSFQALGVDLVNIFPNQSSFLIIVTSTAKGNGGHGIYRVSSDTLENIYDSYYGYNTQTYDAGEDRWIYEPNELTLSVKDFNKDGYNDIVFEGKLVLIQGVVNDSIWYDNAISNGKDTIRYSVDNPFKKLPLKFVFLYNSKTGHFVKNNKFSMLNPFD